MGKHEITKAQWTAVMTTTPWSGQALVLDEADSPAVYVSWDDAQAFVMQLNILTAETFRLPSEAEWEYACRAGTSTRYYWGDDAAHTTGNDYAWWYPTAYAADEKYAHVVGQKLPNAFGLHDVSGNAWEWCEDDWHDSYTGAPPGGAPWLDSPRGSLRVLRGGSWGGDPHDCRSARRAFVGPSGGGSNIGFRVVK
jgi:formylglycine-generating enzyme required for sulfatase activity